MNETEMTFTNSGQILTHHPVAICHPPCPIHAPSDHHMVTWPLHWRDDRWIMERLCPHAIGHPDPDDYKIRTGMDDGDHYSCDGCCHAND